VLEGSRGTIVIWVVAAVLATLAAARLLGGSGGDAPPPVKLDGGVAASAGAAGAGSGDPSARDRVFVHVAGAVRRPGLYRLGSDARVAEALHRAGGPLPRAELTAVNLAARVADGQQVVVPVAGKVSGATTPAAPGGSGDAGGAGAGVKLSLASATAEQLEELDGIGPTLAERIIEYRDAQGGLASLDQLNEVDGIGEERLASLREGLQP
jgi:competence protein ComEA